MNSAPPSLAIATLEAMMQTAVSRAGIPPSGVDIVIRDSELLLSYDKGNADQEKWALHFLNCFEDAGANVETSFRLNERTTSGLVLLPPPE